MFLSAVHYITMNYKSVFEGNTDNVSYITPEGETVELGKCHYFRGIKDDEGKYLFFLNPIKE